MSLGGRGRVLTEVESGSSTMLLLVKIKGGLIHDSIEHMDWLGLKINVSLASFLLSSHDCVG